MKLKKKWNAPEQLKKRKKRKKKERERGVKISFY